MRTSGRVPRAEGHARRHGCRDPVARARHRRQHGDLLDPRQPDAASLPVKEPQHLGSSAAGQSATDASWTNPIWEQVRDRQQLFDGAFAWSTTRFNLAQGGQTELVDGVWASGRFFDVLGVPAILGRTFTRGRRSARRRTRRPGRGHQLSASGSGASAARRRRSAGSLTIERVPFTIVGVTPPGFFGVDVGRTFDVAIPHRHRAAHPRQESRRSIARSNWWLNVMVRLKPGRRSKPATRRSAACSRRSARRRCRRTGAPQDKDSYLRDGVRR